jgi:hypothetical protein
MSINIEKVEILSDKKAKKRFINLAWDLYKDDKNWVPLLKMELNKMFDKSHPFYKTADVAFWIATKDGKDVGRIMGIVNHHHNEFHKEQAGHYGFFEAIDDKEVFSGLLNTASEWLKEQGMETLSGPFNPSTNYECGNLVKGHGQRPVLMMPYNPEYYQKHIEELGFSKAKDLIAYHINTGFEMPEIIQKVAARAEKSNKITYRTVEKKNWDREVKLMYEIYNDAWEDNWGFIPMTKDEFFGMAKDLKAVVDERLMLFALVDGKAAGFIVALPDFNQVLKEIPNGKLLPTGIFKVLRANKYMTGVRVLTMGVKQAYRKYGLASILYQRCYQNILKYPQYKDIEMSWILEDNLNMNKPLIRMNAQPYRVYRIFEKGL